MLKYKNGHKKTLLKQTLSFKMVIREELEV